MLLAVFKRVSQYQMHSTDPKYLYAFAIACYKLSPGMDFSASVSADFCCQMCFLYLTIHLLIYGTIYLMMI